MQLFKLAATLQAFAAVTFAAPQSLETRGSVGVYLCTAFSWKGTCEHQFAAPGQCRKNSRTLLYTSCKY